MSLDVETLFEAYCGTFEKSISVDKIGDMYRIKFIYHEELGANSEEFFDSEEEFALDLKRELKKLIKYGDFPREDHFEDGRAFETLKYYSKFAEAYEEWHDTCLAKDRQFLED